MSTVLYFKKSPTALNLVLSIDSSLI